MPERHLDHIHDDIEAAYHEFKGGCDTKIESKRMLNVVSTARTNGVRVDGNNIKNCVHVHLKPGHAEEAIDDDHDPDEVPAVVERAAERHGLVEVKRKTRYDSDELETVSYALEWEVPDA